MQNIGMEQFLTEMRLLLASHLSRKKNPEIDKCLMMRFKDLPLSVLLKSDVRYMRLVLDIKLRWSHLRFCSIPFPLSFEMLHLLDSISVFDVSVKNKTMHVVQTYKVRNFIALRVKGDEVLVVFAWRALR